MGLPEVVISFARKAESFIQRSSRGMVVLLVQDTTKEQLINPYESIVEVNKADYTAETYKVITLAFKGKPSAVLVVRMVMEDTTADLVGTLKLIEPINLDYLVYPEYETKDKEILESFIKKVRSKGKKAKAVLPKVAADYEGIINFATDNITVKWDEESEVEVYTNKQYCCRIAGILAGLSITQSSTFYVMDEIVNVDLSDNPGVEIDAGKLIIFFDGEKYKIARGVTSLVTVALDHPEDFKKIKIVEASDLIKSDIYRTFEDDFIGKLNNTYDNKQYFIGLVCKYLKTLEGTLIDGNTENYVQIDILATIEYLKNHGTYSADLKEQEIKEANTGAYMLLSGKIKFLDAVEDLILSLSM